MGAAGCVAAWSALTVALSIIPVVGSPCFAWKMPIAFRVLGPMTPSCSTHGPSAWARPAWAHWIHCGPSGWGWYP